VGLLGFGGPLASMAMMRDELVEKNKLISSSRYLEGLGVVKLLPGPVSTLLAVFLGQEIFGILGGILSAFLFMFPSFLMLLIISVFEEFFKTWVGDNSLSSLRFVAQSLQAAVIAIIFYNCVRLFVDAATKEYFGKQRPRLATSFAVIAGALAFVHVSEILILFFSTLSSLFLFYLIQRINFSKFHLNVEPLTIFGTFFFAGLTVFGTGYMVLPYLQRILVEQNQWLTAGDFLNAVTWGNLTPGPVVIASTYMGFKIDGFAGSVAATLGIFLGPIVLMLVLGPVLRKFLGRPWVDGLLMGLLPAVASTIAVSLLMLAQGIDWIFYFYIVLLISFFSLWKYRIAAWKVLGLTASLSFVISMFL
jgi:chromate transporter